MVTDQEAAETKVYEAEQGLEQARTYASQMQAALEAARRNHETALALVAQANTALETAKRIHRIHSQGKA